jgi:hypothetical protein
MVHSPHQLFVKHKSQANRVQVNHTGRYRPLLYLGPCILLLGNSLYTTFTATSSLPHLVIFQIISGLGTGLLFLAPLLALQVNVSPAETATATSTMGFTRNLATCLSVVVGGVIFQSGMEGRGDEFRAAGLSEVLVEKLTTNAAANVGLIREIADEGQRMVVQQAFSGSLKGIWYVCMGMAALAVLASGCVSGKVLSRKHEETRTGIPGDVKQAAVV